MLQLVFMKKSIYPRRSDRLGQVVAIQYLQKERNWYRLRMWKYHSCTQLQVDIYTCNYENKCNSLEFTWYNNTTYNGTRETSFWQQYYFEVMIYSVVLYVVLWLWFHWVVHSLKDATSDQPDRLIGRNAH